MAPVYCLTMSMVQERSKDAARVVECTITPVPRHLGDSLPEVWALFDDDTAGLLFRYYPDEVSFEPAEFLGLTREEARRLHGGKYRKYLRSP